MIIGASGRVVHHNDCTYCRHRQNVPVGKKRKRIIYQERCALTGEKIAPPLTIERFCTSYQQIGCECDKCHGEVVTEKTGLFALHSLQGIDK